MAIADLLKSIQTEFTNLESLVKTKDADVTAKTQEIAKLNATISALNATVRAKDADLSKLNATVRAKDSDIAKLNTTITQKDALIKELQSKLRASAPTPVSSFKVLNATRFRDDPDLSSFGLSNLEIIYTRSMWPTNDYSVPNLNYIKQTVVPKWKDKFPNLKVLCIDIEHWKLYGQTVDMLKKMVQFHLDVLRAFREVWPGVKLGYYGEIPVRSISFFTGTPTENVTRLANWKANHDAMKPLWDAVDIVFPSLYAIGATATDQVLFDKYVKAMVAEARRCAPSKPVWPVLWIEPHPGGDHTNTFSGERWYQMLTSIHEVADSVVIWSMAGGSPNFDYNRPWWLATKKFIADKKLTA